MCTHVLNLYLQFWNITAPIGCVGKAIGKISNVNSWILMNGLVIVMKTQSWSTNRSSEWNEQIHTYSKILTKKKVKYIRQQCQ